jgi:ubiquinone/menaquinone biosynthesis C-methylase UbiE
VTARLRRTYDEFAPRYDRVIGWSERLFLRGGRAWVAARVKGETLEIGVGTGRNLPHYPPAARLSGVDISREMLKRARRRARELGRPAEFVQADAQRLPFPDRRFDTVVSTLSLCTIPDERAALAEAARVLRPGGRLILLEHVRSGNPIIRWSQRALEPIFLRLCCDHLLREPLDELPAGGFALQELERRKGGIVERAVLVRVR